MSNVRAAECSSCESTSSSRPIQCWSMDVVRCGRRADDDPAASDANSASAEPPGDSGSGREMATGGADDGNSGGAARSDARSSNDGTDGRLLEPPTDSGMLKAGRPTNMPDCHCGSNSVAEDEAVDAADKGGASSMVEVAVGKDSDTGGAVMTGAIADAGAVGAGGAGALPWDARRPIALGNPPELPDAVVDGGVATTAPAAAMVLPRTDAVAEDTAMGDTMPSGSLATGWGVFGADLLSTTDAAVDGAVTVATDAAGMPRTGDVDTTGATTLGLALVVEGAEEGFVGVDVDVAAAFVDEG